MISPISEDTSTGYLLRLSSPVQTLMQSPAPLAAAAARLNPRLWGGGMSGAREIAFND
jgi:hypothetical protein